jgi:hypothetical protein
MSVDRIQKALRDEKKARIATIVVWIAVVAVFPIMAVAQWLPDRGCPPAGFLNDVVFPVVGVSFFACQVLAVPMLAWYVLRYRRGLDLARGDAGDAALVQLQETVARLADHVSGDDE